MENVEIIEVVNPYSNEVSQHVIIRESEDTFTTMPKAVWDEQQKAAEEGGTL